MFDGAFQKLQKAFDQLEAATTAVQLLEPDPAYETQANAAFNDMEEAVSEFSKAAKKRKDDGGDTTGGGASTSKRVAKSVDALKPDVLTKAMKPTEFRNWRRPFDDWYTTSCFDTMTMEGQIAFLRSVLETDLISLNLTCISFSSHFWFPCVQSGYLQVWVVCF